jgi:hypothetical protein
MFTRDEALKLDRFPGALQSETLLGQAWIREHGAPYAGFDFNVALGDGRDPGDTIAPAIREAAIEASKPRADIIAYGDGFVDLLEVKGRGDAAALGQLVQYSVLWNRAHPDEPVRHTGVIVAVVDPTMLSIYNSAAIPIFIYSDLTAYIRRT